MVTLRSGHYLVASPAAYQVIAVSEDTVLVQVAAGSRRFHRRRITWERSNIEANIALGIITVATEYAAPATETAAPSLLGEEGEGS